MNSPDTRFHELPSLSTPITVSGNRSLSLSGEALSMLPIETKTVTIKCASGTRNTATWAGIPVLELLSAADVSDETTHLVVESDGGYRMCVDIRAALDGLVAFFRDGTPILECEPYETRFITPGVDGARTVKAVALLEARHLSPSADPESVEEISREEEYSA
ncbi:hypothetical protein DJ68_04195 [Halorubrum sp. C3]|nr:hypothetical protein DJ68_04195 [Halorubrum sp. C3]